LSALSTSIGSTLLTMSNVESAMAPWYLTYLVGLHGGRDEDKSSTWP